MEERGGGLKTGAAKTEPRIRQGSEKIHDWWSRVKGIIY